MTNIVNKPQALYYNGELIGIITNADPLPGGLNTIIEALNSVADDSVEVKPLDPAKVTLAVKDVPATPGDEPVSDTRIVKNDPRALAWWANLSINEQREFRNKYFPDVSMLVVVCGYKWIENIWEKEGRPEPQELIPIDVDFL